MLKDRMLKSVLSFFRHNSHQSLVTGAQTGKKIYWYSINDAELNYIKIQLSSIIVFNNFDSNLYFTLEILIKCLKPSPWKVILSIKYVNL